MNLQELSARVSTDFANSFGRPPRWIVAAPGRVNVIGEHTDYNDGFVLPMAIEFFAVMAGDRSSDGKNVVRVHSSSDPEPAMIDLSAPLRAGKPKWSNYSRGVLAGFLARGINPGGLDVVLHSTVPLGGGLSSSAALEVCTATLVEAVSGKQIDPVEKALLCQKAEHEFAGVPCGIMDQFISVMGRKDHLLLLDCRSRKTELVPMRDPAVELLIANTNVKHELGSGQYAKRRAQCEAAAQLLGVPSLRDASAEALERVKSKMEEVVFRRARHVIGEIERTVQAAGRVRASDWPQVGELMYASHRSLRDDYEVSCAELDALVEIAESIGLPGGVFGCRMTGGGFGGCVVALVKSDAVAAISKKLGADYKKKTGMDATIFGSRPAGGASIIKA
ncbi:MAG TPA: galactokinase [Candidatus Saccharimonadales bacterium]|nr:galactokinase [Candidatus Saccharimonadales bacterium]